MDENYYYATGVAEATVLTKEKGIASAKQNALRSLAEMIQVSVRNELKQIQSSISSNGASVLSESRVNSVTETSTAASLQDVEVVDSWTDPDTCSVWLRVRVPRKLVEQKQREIQSSQLFEILQGKLSVAQDTTNSADKREEAVSAGLGLLEHIDFSLLKGAGSLDYFRQLLAKLNNDIQAAMTDAEKAQLSLHAVDNNMQLAVSASETGRGKYYAEAVRQARSLLALYPNGLPNVFAANDLKFRLAEIEEKRGNVCAARTEYTQLNEADPGMAEAKRRADLLGCNPEDQEKENWRNYFDGRDVELQCYISIDGKVSPWRKICDAAATQLGNLGLTVKQEQRPLQATELHALLAGTGTIDQSGASVPIYFLAEGKMNRKRDPDQNGPSGFEYQFSGAIGSQVFEGSKAAFSDRFDGMTGWNPFSEQMVEDVLALNVFKRWKNKFGEFVTGK